MLIARLLSEQLCILLVLCSCSLVCMAQIDVYPAELTAKMTAEQTQRQHNAAGAHATSEGNRQSVVMSRERHTIDSSIEHTFDSFVRMVARACAASIQCSSRFSATVPEYVTREQEYFPLLNRPLNRDPLYHAHSRSQEVYVSEMLVRDCREALRSHGMGYTFAAVFMNHVTDVQHLRPLIATCEQSNCSLQVCDQCCCNDSVVVPWHLRHRCYRCNCSSLESPPEYVRTKREDDVNVTECIALLDNCTISTSTTEDLDALGGTLADFALDMARAIALELDIVGIDPRVVASEKFFEGYLNDIRAVGIIMVMVLFSLAVLAVFRQAPDAASSSSRTRIADAYGKPNLGLGYSS